MLSQRAFCQPGTHELCKGAVHAALLAIAATCATYNVAAWWYRRERRLAQNVAIYGALVGYETIQTWRHWGHNHDA